LLNAGGTSSLFAGLACDLLVTEVTDEAAAVLSATPPGERSLATLAGNLGQVDSEGRVDLAGATPL